MRPSRKPLVLAALTLAAGLAWCAGTARAQAAGGPYPGYYYSPGGYSGGYYFRPGYYPIHSVAATRPVAAVPARGYVQTVPRRHVYVNHEDWSTGRTNYPVPLTKPWMLPLRYTVP